MLTDPEPMDAVSDLAVLTRLLDTRTEVRVPQRDAPPIAARGIDNLSSKHGAVCVNPITTPPAVCGRGVSDLLAIALLLCW